MPKLKPDNGPVQTNPEHPYDPAMDTSAMAGMSSEPYDRDPTNPGSPMAAPVDDRPRDDEFDFVGLEDIREHLNVCYYGREGTIKTTALASMVNLPDPGRLLVVNAEGGLKRSALQRRGIDTSRIVTWPKPGVTADYESLERLFWKLHADLQDDPNSWLGVGIDSGTEVSTVILEGATTRGIAMGASQGKARFDRFVVDRDDYRVMTDQMRSLIRKFRDLPCHFVITALEREDEVTLPDGSKVQMWGPAFSPKLAQDVLGYVDMVIRTQADRVEGPDGPYTEVVGYTRATRAYRAKDRFGATPDPMAVPTFDRLVQYVNDDFGDDAPDIEQENFAEKREATAAYRADQERAKQEAKDAVRAARKPPAKKAAPAAAPKEEQNANA